MTQAIETSRSRTDEVVGNVNNEYSQACQQVNALMRQANDGIYFFKHFEHAFEVKELQPIQKIFAFKHEHQDKILINAGCDSYMERWNAESRTLEHINNIKTGVVKDVVAITTKPEESYLVILSDYYAKQCVYCGLYVHKIKNHVFTSFKKLDDAHSVKAIKASPFNTFYILSDNHKVCEYDVNLKLLEDWQLPKIEGEYRFLPSELGIGLALSDGKSLVSLTSVRANKSRRKRSLGSDKNLLKTLTQEFGHGDYGFNTDEIQAKRFDNENSISAEEEQIDSGNDEQYYEYSEQYPEHGSNIVNVEETVPDSQRGDVPQYDYESDPTTTVNNNYKLPIQPSLASQSDLKYTDALRDKQANINLLIDVSNCFLFLSRQFQLTFLNNFQRIQNKLSSTTESTSTSTTRQPVFTVPVNGFSSDYDEKVELTDMDLESNDTVLALQSKDDSKFVDQSRDKLAQSNKNINVSTYFKNTFGNFWKPLETSSNFLLLIFSFQILKNLLSTTKTYDVFNNSDFVEQSQNITDDTNTYERLDNVTLPHLQSIDDKKFGDQVRDKYSKVNEKISAVSESISFTSTEKTKFSSTTENVPLSTAELELLTEEEVTTTETDLKEELSRFESLAKQVTAQSSRIKPLLSNKSSTNTTPQPPNEDLVSLQKKLESFNAEQKLQEWPSTASDIKERLLSSSFGNSSEWKESMDMVREKLKMKSNKSSPVPEYTKFDSEDLQNIDNEVKIKLTQPSSSPVLKSTTMKPVDLITKKPNSGSQFKNVPKWNQNADFKSVEDLVFSAFNETNIPIKPKVKITTTTVTPTVVVTDASTTQNYIDTVLQSENDLVQSEKPIQLNNEEKDLTTEAVIGEIIPEKGIKITANNYLPESGKGEIVVMKVGAYDAQRKLVAVSVESSKKIKIPGKYDVIQVSTRWYS